MRDRPEPSPIPSGVADAVLDALPHPVIMVASDDNIANANAAAGGMLSYWVESNLDSSKAA